MSAICLDASFVLDLLLPTPMTAAAERIWRDLASREVALVAPPLLFPETASGIRRWVHTSRVSAAAGETLFQYFCRMDFGIVAFPHLYRRAWQLATQFNQPRVYDAQYLAVAEHEGCELWTSDRRLYNTAHSVLPWVRLVS